MNNNQLQKLFGIGPTGASISFLLLALFAWVAQLVDLPIVVLDAAPIKLLGIAFAIFGFGLHLWSLFTLRNWWKNDQLCTMGPFQYFRHPMYAAWITFISSGLALYLNSWVYLLWVISLHPIWHKLVTKEESIMIDTFGDIYKDYAIRTGRFFPMIFTHRK